MAKKRFAVFDIDGTLIRWQLYHAIADELAKSGHIDAETYTAIRNARAEWKKRTHEDSFKAYEEQLVIAYRILLTKLTVPRFELAAEAVFREYKDQVYVFTRDLIKELKKKGYVLLAISGSQSEIVQKIADYYGFDDFVGSYYHREKGRFTGKIDLTVFSKDKVLQALLDKHGLTLNGSIAVGDSSSDIPMMELVERPIAFNPERTLLAHAQKSHWEVVVERKNVIYELKEQNGSYVLAQTEHR